MILDYRMSMNRYPSSYHDVRFDCTKLDTLELQLRDVSKDIIIELFDADNYVAIIGLLYGCDRCDSNFKCSHCEFQMRYVISNLIDYYIGDIDFLKRIFEKNRDTKITLKCSSIQKILSNADARDIFLNEKCPMIDIEYIFNNCIQNMNVDAIQVLFDYKYECEDLIQVICSGSLDIIQCFQSNGYDLQSVLDECDFDNDWYGIDKNGLQVLVKVGINLSKNINDIMLISCSDIDLVKFCIEYGATNINSVFVSSCMNSSIEVIGYLLHMGADIKSVTEDELLGSDIDTIILLIEHGYNFSIDGLNKIFVWLFASEDDINKLSFIFYLVGSFDYLFSTELDNRIVPMMGDSINPDSKISKLEYIVSKNKIPHIKFIVDNSFDKFQFHIDRLFIIGVANGHIDMVKYLLDLGADIHIGNNLALRTCIFFGHYPMVLFLMERQIELTNHVDNLFMIGSYGSGYRDYKKIGYAKLINGTNSFRNDRFNYGLDYLDIFKLLISARLDIPDRTFFKMLYPTYYNVELVSYFIANGTDINYVFMYVIHHEIVDIANFLLENGVDPHPHITFAAKRNSKKIIKLLMKYGADIIE